MAGAIFKNDVRKETGKPWEQWLAELGREADPLWSHEQLVNHVRERHRLSEEWGEWIASMFGQAIGRSPVGVTKDAGVQIGARKTFAVSKPEAWAFLTSREGLSLWIGEVPDMRWERGYSFESREGLSGKLSVVIPELKIRTTWKRPEWENFSRLQLTFLETRSGKTTVAIHQEMLDDVYVREIMRRHWEAALNAIGSRVQ